MTDNQTEQPDCLLQTPEDIYGALRKLVLMQESVQVQIDGSEQQYKAELINTDFRSRSFFMTEVVPDDGNQLIRQGHRFRIDSDHQGIYIGFRADGRLRFQPGEHQYRAEFPSEVTYRQRRSSYRVEVPAAHRLQLSLPLPDLDKRLFGQLLDLSENGFKARFSGNLQHQLHIGSQFPGASIRFNEEHHMDCDLEIRHLLLNEHGDTLAGFVFTLISSDAQRYIRKLITDFQWEERERKRLREENHS